MFAFGTPILLESHPLSEYPNGVYPSVEDVAELVDIMDAFRLSLLTAPRAMYDIFWINCTVDALRWGGLKEGARSDGTPPPPTAWIDFDDVGCDRIGGATPAGLHMIMFEQKGFESSRCSWPSNGSVTAYGMASGASISNRSASM